MNTINITTQFCEEDRKRLDELIGSIAFLTSVIGTALPKATQQTVIAKATEAPQVVEPTPAAEPVTEEPAPEPVAEPAPEVKPVSLSEFQKAVTLAVSKGAEAKQAVKSIINKYAPSVSGVPEDKRAEVIAELSKI